MESTGVINYHCTTPSSRLYSLLLFLLVFSLSGCPVNAKSHGLTAIQGVYIISVIGIFYFTVFLIMLILTCCLCNWRRRGRVCPISQDERLRKKERQEYVEVKSILNTRSVPNLNVANEKQQKSSKDSEDAVDLAIYPNLAYQETSVDSENTSKPANSSDSTTVESGSKGVKSGKKLVHNDSTATVFTNPDTDYNSGSEEDNDCVTEI